MSTIRAAKIALRKSVKARLKDLQPEVISEESGNVLKCLLSMKEYQTAKNISIYLSMPKGEIQTTDIIRDLFQRGKNVYIPHWNPLGSSKGNDEMEMVKLHSWEDFVSLPHNSWGIPEPKDGEEREKAFEKVPLDLIVMPGLAFDDQGNRLGHGKGYYDKYISKSILLSKSMGVPKPTTIALALSAQIVSSDTVIPTDQFDLKPDYIIVGDKIRKIN
ncbi:5-formyltetrahydrofolate cyclo-ligase [Paraphysoderma sedebokerense]|nr:5-formyltetrahydrofolate cyclo-ligase [Paraphysoderma sedebokerense]